ncbi:MAG: DAK2 domain-containing protein [Clostridiales bacterium]|nr:DAK2 domain-containing protein [Clostridiales bacterium]
MVLKQIDSALFREMFLNGVVLLQQNKEKINALNVFPVPDGDTGTNMLMTLKSALGEMQQVRSESLSALADAISKGSLKGARGNSGVILSQLFRGFARSIHDKESISAREFAAALRLSSETAYKAVMKPREGTVLTVSRVMGEVAAKAAEQTDNVIDVMRRALDAGWDVLARTPDMLDVLKRAGVVDAGGQGLLTFMNGYMAAIRGDTPMGSLEEVVVDRGSAPDAAAPAISQTEIEFGYCTEFIVNPVYPNVDDADVDRFKNRLDIIGDSVVVVSDVEYIKVHVHSNMPGKVVQYALRLGELTSIKIENMREQHRSILEMNAQAQPERDYAIVTVAAGDGMKDIFTDLGAEGFVEGGQTMNPSTDELVTVINAMNARTVFVLPNNSNIIMAARQTQELTRCRVIVIPSKSIPQGISALLAFNAELTPAQNEAAMTRALESVKTGQVTYAVRDSDIDGQDIHTGDIMGIGNGHINVVGRDPNAVAAELCAALLEEGGEIITLFYGQDVTGEQAQELVDRLQREHPGCDVECHRGGQPLYYYILSVE